MAKVTNQYGSYEAVLLHDDVVEVTTFFALTGTVVNVEQIPLTKCEAIAALLVEELGFAMSDKGVN